MNRLDRRRRSRILLVGLHLESAIKALAAQGFDVELRESLPESLPEPTDPAWRHPDLVVVSDLSGVSALAAASFILGRLRVPVLSLPRGRCSEGPLSLLHIAIFKAIAVGQARTKAIAHETGYSERRVDAALHELEILLETSSRAETIAVAYALGLIYQSRDAWNDPLGEATES
jgi:hypothetical protein